MSSLLIRTRDVEEPQKLERALNDILGAIDLRLQALEASTRVFLVGQVDVRTDASVAAGTLPFPIRLGLPQGFTMQGLVLLGAENLSTAGVAGITTTPIAINAWHQDGPFVLIDFITGLSTDTSYRFNVGGFRAF